MWHTGLVAPQDVRSSRTRAQTRVPCIGRQILNHCTTREAQFLFFSYISIFTLLFCCSVLFSLICFFSSFSLIYILFFYISISTLLFCCPVFFPFLFYFIISKSFLLVCCFLALFFSWHIALVKFLGFVFLLVWILIV